MRFRVILRYRKPRSKLFSQIPQGRKALALDESFSSPPILSRLYEIDERCNVKERDMECVSYE